MPTAPGGLNLTETKVLSAKFLSSGAFTEEERFLPALFASADTNSRLSDIGDDMLKRALPAVSLEDNDLVQKLYDIYLGSKDNPTRPPVLPRLQTKILDFLCKSQIATSYTTEIISIVRAGLGVDAESSNKSVQGLSGSRLKTRAVNFTAWVARMASQSNISKVAPELVLQLREYIENQGWPTVSQEAQENSLELNQRSLGYECIGLLGKSCPDKLLFEPNLDLVRWLFQSLGGDQSHRDVSLSIEQALSSVIRAFAQNDTQELQEPLVNLLSHYAILQPGDEDSLGMKIIRSTRYVAVRFSNRCLYFKNARGRLIALLALSGGSNERNEVIEEGTRGIDPHWYRILNPTETMVNEELLLQNPRYQMPDFEELINLVFADLNAISKLGNAYAPSIAFCWTVLLHKAMSNNSKSPIVDADWQKNIQALIQNDEEVREGIKKFFSRIQKSNGMANALHLFANAAFTGFSKSQSENKVECGKCLLELWQFASSDIIDHQIQNAPALKDGIFSSDHGTRVLAGRLLGIMASRPNFKNHETQDLVETLTNKASSWKTAIGSGIHQAHGSLLALGYLASRSQHHELRILSSDSVISLVCNILQSSTDKDLLEAATLTISQLSLFGILNSEDIKNHNTTDDFVAKLSSLAKKGNENAILAQGHFAMQCGETSESPLQKIVADLYSLHEVRQPELHFAVGAALSCAAIGWQSKYLIGAMDINGFLPRMPERVHLLEEMIDKVLSNCKETKPSLRQASVIWLLCLVQYCGHCEEVIARLHHCQVAFKGFLSDKEVLNQEAASRGLTLIYEKGDRNLKDDLIRDLVSSFTSTNSNLSGSVSADTELFEPGALPTGEGQSVTTYKDIINLANEVGDPSLVYRFMNLASNSAIWSSRSAFGRFGLSRILSDSGVDGYLAQNPKLYSALFRYRFDPNSNVRSAMNDIWTALVKDPKTIIETHFERILQDLLKSILNKEWRTRYVIGASRDFN
jgi:proteasome component ECM29